MAEADPRSGLQRLIRPRTLLVAGGEEAAEVIRQCRQIGFEGALWALHPKRDAIEGVRCVRRVADLAGAPDASFLAVPPQACVTLVGELAARGAGGAVCYASGFAEAGPTGAALQQALVQAALAPAGRGDDGGMALVGPNCYGLLNLLDGVALWPDRHGSARLAAGQRGVALVTQSGNIALNLTMQRRHVPLASVWALGNAAVVDFADVITALLTDDRISAIGLHIEGLSDIPAFAAAAQAAAKAGVPIVALKTGASQLGARLAASHTSALAGADALYDALFGRVGIARVNDLGELLETLKLLHAGGALLPAAPERPQLAPQSAPRANLGMTAPADGTADAEPPFEAVVGRAGPRVGALSCSGGEASLLADLGEAAGLVFPPLGAAATERLSAVLGPKVALGNPLDYHTYIWADVPRLTACFAALMSAPIDIALLVLDFPFYAGARPEGWDEALAAFMAARTLRAGRGAIVSTLPELMPAAQAQALLAAGIAPLQGLREAAVALCAAARIGALRAHAINAVPLPRAGRACPHGRAADAAFDTAADTASGIPSGSPPDDAPGTPPGSRTLDEAAAKQALAAHGLAVPPSRLVSDANPDARTAAALAAARALGYPVVLKAVGADLTHKTELGAVKLNLRDDAALRAAAQALADHPRWLVEKMVTDGLAELIVGVTHDAQFGLALTLGAGGIWVELLADSVTLLLPAGADEVERALRRLQCFPLLNGYRGRPKANLSAVVDAVLAITRYAHAMPDRLVALDVNPLIATAKGAVAVDALIVLAGR
jgi:acetyl-CoA synthetase